MMHLMTSDDQNGSRFVSIVCVLAITVFYLALTSYTNRKPPLVSKPPSMVVHNLDDLYVTQRPPLFPLVRFEQIVSMCPTAQTLVIDPTYLPHVTMAFDEEVDLQLHNRESYSMALVMLEHGRVGVLPRRLVFSLPDGKEHVVVQECQDSMAYCRDATTDLEGVQKGRPYTIVFDPHMQAIDSKHNPPYFTVTITVARDPPPVNSVHSITDQQVVEWLLHSCPTETTVTFHHMLPYNPQIMPKVLSMTCPSIDNYITVYQIESPRSPRVITFIPTITTEQHADSVATSRIGEPDELSRKIAEK